MESMSPTRPPPSPSISHPPLHNGYRRASGSNSRPSPASANAAAAAAALSGAAGGADSDYNDDYEKDSQAGSRRQSIQFVQTGFCGSAGSTINNGSNVRLTSPTNPSTAASINNGAATASRNAGGGASSAPTRAASPMVESTSQITSTTTNRMLNSTASPQSVSFASPNSGVGGPSGGASTSAAARVNGGPDTYMAIEEELRHTAEYKVAWDLELWRMVQRQRIEKEVKDYRKKLHDDAKTTLLAQEREIKRELEKAIAELAAKEKVFEEEERKQDRRKTKLLEAEREMERRGGLLIDQRKRLDEECEQRVKRFKAEFDHKEELSLQRLQTLQDTCKRTEQRVEAGQKEYLKLWEEFADFRTKTLTTQPTEGVAMERLRTQHANETMLLQERLERTYREQLMDINRRLEGAVAEAGRATTALAHKKEQLRQCHRENTMLTAKVEALEARLAAVENQQNSTTTRLITAAAAASPPPSCPLASADPASEIAMLRGHLQRSIDRERCGGGSPIGGLLKVAANNAGGNMALASAGSAAAASPSTATIAVLYEQLNRWRTERQKLMEMSGGAYDEESAVIVALDSNIRRAEQRLAALETSGAAAH